ncbi:MAG: hypothetical protein V2I57_10755 [Xanthomonadales bacterium]|nr:hypothetical protein [Xanthomonadales bacterium]
MLSLVGAAMLIGMASLSTATGRFLMLGLVCALVAANSLLGFVLGGVIPGGVLLFAAGILGFAARAASEESRGQESDPSSPLTSDDLENTPDEP